MNPQPPEYIGVLFSILFVGLIIVNLIKEFNKKDCSQFNDLFTLGYIEESSPRSIQNINITQVETKASIESQQLYIDCIEALSALGMKKSEAKKRTKQVFASTFPQPQSVQEFLLIALRK